MKENHLVMVVVDVMVLEVSPELSSQLVIKMRKLGEAVEPVYLFHIIDIRKLVDKHQLRSWQS